MDATGTYPHGYCGWCSNPEIGSLTYHTGVCPKVKEIEYHPNGIVKRVIFHDSDAIEYRDPFQRKSAVYEELQRSG